MKKSIWVVASIAILFTSFVSPIYATNVPTFPSCVNPQGEIKVSYSDGTHGIVGSTETYVGRDTVYTLTDDTLTQCFCSVDGQGIQTDWWKASSLTDSEITILKTEGWVYVPAGNLWGLSTDPYLAKNTTYSCLPSSSNPPSNGGSSSSNSSSGSSSDPSLDNGTGGGDILGLAATGDSLYVYGIFALGLTFVTLGLARVIKHN